MVRRILAVMALLLASSLGVVSSAIAAARPGARVTVALFGDSVAESLLISNYLTDGLAPQIARAEGAFGFVPGGVGLIPAAPFRWHFNRVVTYGTASSPTDGWTAIGDAGAPGLDGPSGYSALASSPHATATVSVSDPDLEVLFNSSAVHCLFTVSAAGRTWTIDTYRRGPSFDAEAPVRLPPGTHELTVHGPSCGFLSFDGVIAQAPVPPGKVQIEVDNLGHAGHSPWIDLTPRVEQLLSSERYDVSVFLFGYIGELEVTGQQPTAYLDSMIARGRIARAHGRACLIVAPTPIDVPASAVTLIAGLDRLAARRTGCHYTTVLTHLWSSWSAAENEGLVLVDGVHPTAKGYTLIAHALAPVIAGLARSE